MKTEFSIADGILELENLEELSISNNSFERKKYPKTKDFKKLKKLSK